MISKDDKLNRKDMDNADKGYYWADYVSQVDRGREWVDCSRRRDLPSNHHTWQKL